MMIRLISAKRKAQISLNQDKFLSILRLQIQGKGIRKNSSKKLDYFFRKSLNLQTQLGGLTCSIIGSTADFGSVSRGSSPCGSTKYVAKD
jgi:hypothetical protein